MEDSKFPSICIIGAGFSGICAAIKLRTELGLNSFTIFDENEDVGGTWLVNTYPGCACDVPSHLYSFSFEPNPNWSEAYSSGPEIWAYLKNVVTKHNLYPKIRFNHAVKKISWIDSVQKWQVIVLDKSQGTEKRLNFDLLISGIGGLRSPSTPEEFLSFKGTRVHSAVWNSSVDTNDLKDKTVAVVGSGASAVQIIPSIVDKVKKLVVYQRHPAWVMPRKQFEFPSWVKWLFGTVPLTQTMYRAMIFWSGEVMHPAFHKDSWMQKIAIKLANRHLKHQVPNDPELLEKLTPNYTFGCKRVTPSNKYYPALSSTNAEVVRSKITEVKENSIVTEDGNETEIDVLILATGFKVQDYFAPLEIRGKGNVNIMDLWKKEGPAAYLGICSSVLPNTFFLIGPNSGLGHNSIIFQLECQMNYVVKVIGEMMRLNCTKVSVDKSAENAYMDQLLTSMEGTVWGTADCGSWYADHRGVITALSPYSLISYWKKTRVPNFSHFNFE